MVASNIELYGALDLFCAMIIAGLEIATLGHKTSSKKEKFLLYAVLLSESAICVLDFFWVVIDGNTNVSLFVNNAVNCFYFASSFLLCFLWIQYVAMTVGIQRLKSGIFFQFTAWPVFIAAIVTFLSPNTGWLFYIDPITHEYQRGTLYFLQPVFIFIYIAAASIITFFHTSRDKLQRPRNINRAIIFFAVPPIVGGIYQVFRPGIPILNACITFALVYFYIILQQQRNKDQADIILNLSEDYQEIAIVDLHANNIKPFRGYRFLTYLSSDAMQGYSYEDAVLLSARNFIHPDDREMFISNLSRKNVKQELVASKSILINARIRYDKNSEDFEYGQIKLVSLDEGLDTVNNFILAVKDMDDEIKKEKEIQSKLEDARLAADAANRTKSAFLFNMSHDIRTPMNAVLGFTAMAKKNITDEEKVEDCLDKVESAGLHLLSLINDVLDMARIESGKVKLEVKPVNMKSAVDNLVSMVGDLASNKHIDFKVRYENLTTENILADDLHVNQIILNVISNAIKYTNEGGSVLYTIKELESDNDKKAKFNFIITDTGMGMSDEFQKHIFDTFEREASSSISGIQGTGLGMAITKQLVDIMGGDIKVESKLGWGTTITITLDFDIFEGDIEKGEISTETYEVELEGKRVLLVEDNELNREIAEEILEDVGIIVEEAVDGEEAVEIIRNSDPGYFDLILMDIQMPKMNGYEATEAIRNLPETALSEIPILAMTANAFEEDKQNALKAGMNGHLAKPIDIEKLMKAMVECTNGRR